MVNIAIDGPAGAGKSTIAKRVAKELNYIYVDTGALYRAIAYDLLRKKVDVEDEAALTKALGNIAVSIRYEADMQQVYVNGENVTGYLRTEEVGNMASVVSAKPAVRMALLELQRTLAKENNVVMDGRDIGTHVLPDAQVKVYLTASVSERARRRYQELLEKGMEADLAQIEQDISKRDYRDMHREIAPLKQAQDAVYIDSSDLSVEQVVARIRGLLD